MCALQPLYSQSVVCTHPPQLRRVGAGSRPGLQAQPIPEGSVRHLAIEELDRADLTFLFRAFVNVGDLRDSIRSEGQQMPIIVRPGVAKGFQIVSGFRRVAAIEQLHGTKVAAIVRPDLSDEEAFRASVVENTARRTYSDLDRACLIKAYRERGFSSVDIASLLGLCKRQKNNLLSLLELPEPVRAALEATDGRVTTTHALLLRQALRKSAELDCESWIRRCAEEEMSVAQLKRALGAALRTTKERYFTTMFHPAGTDWQAHRVRLMPAVIDFDGLTRDEKRDLRKELEQMLQLL